MTDQHPIPEGSKAVEFSNGLDDKQSDLLDDLYGDLGSIANILEGLPRHRSYSLAVTKIEEARHWIYDRKHKPA